MFTTITMQTIVITGGTGLVGTQLSKMLVERGYHVIIFTRSPQKHTGTAHLQYAYWDIDNFKVDEAALLKADYIIHLAGAGVVDKKWDAAYRKEILSTRTKSIELILQKLQPGKHHVKALISASATGWYGPDLDPVAPFLESSPAANDFLGNTCRLWELAADEAVCMGIRVCKLRTGIVLSDKAGALPEFIKPLRFGIASILGSGKQVISWIHLTDLCRMYIHAIENSALHGSYNATSPSPVTNKTLVKTLARIRNGNKFITMNVPTFVLKIMMGERSIEVLKSCTVSSQKIQETGFTFQYPLLQEALTNLLANQKDT